MLFKILSVCKGGGYLYCRTEPQHPRCNSKKLYPLHRVVVENNLGRLLNLDEDVHHIDLDKNNNSISNLVAIKKADHSKLHKSKPKIRLICDCGKSFYITNAEARRRIKVKLNNKLSCSRSCGNKFSAKSRNGQVVSLRSKP